MSYCNICGKHKLTADLPISIPLINTCNCDPEATLPEQGATEPESRGQGTSTEPGNPWGVSLKAAAPLPAQGEPPHGGKCDHDIPHDECLPCNRAMAQEYYEVWQATAKELDRVRAASPQQGQGWEPFLVDWGDGVAGHYCIGRVLCPPYIEYWNPAPYGWTASGYLFTDKRLADAVLELLGGQILAAPPAAAEQPKEK